MSHSPPTPTDPMMRTSTSDDINTPLLVVTGVLGTLIIVVIVIASQAAFQYALNKEHDKKVIDQPNAVQATLDEGHAALEDAGIDAAMQDVAAAYAAETPQPPAVGGHDHADH